MSDEHISTNGMMPYHQMTTPLTKCIPPFIYMLINYCNNKAVCCIHILSQFVLYKPLNFGSVDSKKGFKGTKSLFELQVGIQTPLALKKI